MEGDLAVVLSQIQSGTILEIAMRVRPPRPTALGILCAILMGCGGGNTSNSGGGSGGTNPPPPPPPSFTVSLSTVAITLTPGEVQTIQVSVAGQSGFTGSVSVTVTGLPAGVTASPAALSLTPSTPGSLTLTASNSAAAAQASATVNAASGALTVNTALSIAVKVPSLPFPYQSTGGYLVHGFYDETRQLLFATNSELNELDVISATDLSVMNRVPLPTPWGIDQMADGKTLVIGTKAQEIFTVNEDTLAVTRYPVPVSAVTSSLDWDTLYPNPIALANGNVILIAQEFNVDSDDILDGGNPLWNGTPTPTLLLNSRRWWGKQTASLAVLTTSGPPFPEISFTFTVQIQIV